VTEEPGKFGDLLRRWAAEHNHPVRPTPRGNRVRRPRTTEATRKTEKARMADLTRKALEQGGWLVDYGTTLDPTDPDVTAALAFDHAHGVHHHGLPCCDPGQR
jgi:hypothetical protein